MAGITLHSLNVAAAEFEFISRAGVPLWHNKDKSENPCIATGRAVYPYSFSTKNTPKMGVRRGGEKAGLHIKDKFLDDVEGADEQEVGERGLPTLGRPGQEHFPHLLHPLHVGFIPQVWQRFPKCG